MNLTLIGAGNIGLVTALCFAEKGHRVLCLDNDQEKLELLKSGTISFYEPGLAELLKEQLACGQILFTGQIDEALSHSEMVFICVGTPNVADGHPDLSSLYTLVEEISRQSPSGKILVLRSTVPVGTHQKLAARYPQLTFISSPEFLREGSALQDCRQPARVVVGSDTAATRARMEEIYTDFNLKPEQLLHMCPASAEMSKYAANIFLAARISLINEFSQLCDLAGADITNVRAALSADPRIGGQFLNAGLGYGGSCFPKDTAALISYGAALDCELPIARAVQLTNQRQLEIFSQKIMHHFAGIKEKSLAIWGLSFKPDTDDVREAPALKLIRMLLQNNFLVHAYDPRANENVKKIFGSDIQVYDTPEAALKESHALVICTEWSEFTNYDPQRMKALLKSPVIFDGRNIYDPAKMKAYGFSFTGVGRPS